MSDMAVQVDHVAKAYGTQQAVKDVAFEVRAGEIFAMLGPNGSGKTSTIRMILDIIRPDRGRIAVLGGPMTDAKKDQIGYLPEERGLYRNAQIAEVVTYLGTLKGVPRAEARRRATQLLDQLGLAEHTKKKVSELSKGMQQKVQFAVTVLHEPLLMIVDEPFSGLDPVNTQTIKELIAQQRARGCAVIMSTHQMAQVEQMAERMLMIHRGEQKLYGRVADIRRQFAPHAVIVEGTGDWAQLPGVVAVQPHDDGSTTLTLADAATPDAVLGAIANSPAHTIERFALAVPSLEQIFIQVADDARRA